MVLEKKRKGEARVKGKNGKRSRDGEWGGGEAGK